ncbi:MAG: PfkB family carbohydrate kinase [Chloroflexi bacterium]|nr:PfkB family carbohydrate kinase [Chloroflexota bacterium]
MYIPSYLIIGHVTRDVIDSSFRYGGTACYSALTALNLGERVGLVTSAAGDFPFHEALPGIQVVRVPSPSTTVFANIYSCGVRQQFIRAAAGRIHPHNVPKPWRRSTIVHLAPIAQELDQSLARLFPSSLVGLTAQGWLREWDAQGRVHGTHWKNASRVLPHIDVLIVSEDDIAGERSVAEAFAGQVRVVAVTRGERGADVFYRGGVYHSPAFKARAIDTTGAGDAFATAFLVKLQRSGDPIQSARYANCVASFVVEAVGLLGIPRLEQVNKRLRGED